MLVLYLVLMVFHDFKICVVVKHFPFHHFQKFVIIVDIFKNFWKIVQIFFCFYQCILLVCFCIGHHLYLVEINSVDFVSKLMLFDCMNIFHLLFDHFDV